MEEAEKLGCDTPTESMIADAIHDAECEARSRPDFIKYIGREDEMLIFHRNGKYWITLFAPSSEDAVEFDSWMKRQNALVQPTPNP